MKETEMYKVYWCFSEYSISGVQHFLQRTENTIDHYEDSEKYKLLTEVELPKINHNEVNIQAVKSIDDEIAAKNIELNNLRDKRQQLLAITHDEGVKR